MARFAMMLEHDQALYRAINTRTAIKVALLDEQQKRADV